MGETILSFTETKGNLFFVSLLQHKFHKVVNSAVSVGANVMLMNGLPVDVTSLELYELMDRISAEVIPTHQCLLL